jgi:methylmalonyl-CoA mutase cobalamin-binding subunit
MKFSQFKQKVEKILDVDLPPGSTVAGEGRSIAETVNIGRTAFMDKMGIESEAEYKRHSVSNGTIMYHAHIGMNSWETTADALRFIYDVSEEAGFVIDRAGICLDRRMGLPEAYRDRVPAETGPALTSADDWQHIGLAAPIQPHMGDFMIGFPASTANTVNALRAGVTTIGNLSQFFAHEVPMWKDHVTTTVETVRAMSIMGALREKGTLIHSYLEDGYGALFYDCATVAGWAFLERYIVETLVGGKLSHCIGGLTNDPVKRAGWVFALDQIHDADSIGSMFYGDTISFSKDFVKNQGLVAEYLLWDIMAQLECPTGHAVHPLPITEAVRIPSAEEIADAQKLGHRIEQTARKLYPHVDFAASYDFSNRVVTSGKDIFNRALEGLKEAGVDIGDPVQMLYVLKQLGPVVFEKMFGAGGEDEISDPHKTLTVPTDMFEISMGCIEQNRPIFSRPEIQKQVNGRRMLIASSDVHGYGVMVINRLLTEAGAHMINLGTEKDPDEIISAAEENDADMILVSTHNGMALEYAKRLKEEIRKRRLTIPVVMGGVLNQKVEDRALPVDVSQDLEALGFKVAARLDDGQLRKLLT